jgi:hypothetical protein
MDKREEKSYVEEDKDIIKLKQWKLSNFLV